MSAEPSIREWVNGRLRALARAGQSVVVDGRDIGTVVFPDANLKIFLTASATTRAGRRLVQRGDETDPAVSAAVLMGPARPGAASFGWSVAQPRISDGGLPLDGALLSFEEQVARIVELARATFPDLA